MAISMEKAKLYTQMELKEEEYGLMMIWSSGQIE